MAPVGGGWQRQWWRGGLLGDGAGRRVVVERRVAAVWREAVKVDFRMECRVVWERERGKGVPVVQIFLNLSGPDTFVG
jgi:hypothetical protein